MLYKFVFIFKNRSIANSIIKSTIPLGYLVPHRPSAVIFSTCIDNNSNLYVKIIAVYFTFRFTYFIITLCMCKYAGFYYYCVNIDFDRVCQSLLLLFNFITYYTFSKCAQLSQTLLICLFLGT